MEQLAQFMPEVAISLQGDGMPPWIKEFVPARSYSFYRYANSQGGVQFPTGGILAMSQRARERLPIPSVRSADLVKLQSRRL